METFPIFSFLGCYITPLFKCGFTDKFSGSLTLKPTYKFFVCLQKHIILMGFYGFKSNALIYKVRMRILYLAQVWRVCMKMFCSLRKIRFNESTTQEARLFCPKLCWPQECTLLSSFESSCFSIRTKSANYLPFYTVQYFFDWHFVFV